MEQRSGTTTRTAWQMLWFSEELHQWNLLYGTIWSFIMKLVWHQSHSCFVMTSACFLQHVHLGVGGSGEGVTIVYIFCTQKSSTVNRYISSKLQGVRAWVKLLHIPAISLCGRWHFLNQYLHPLLEFYTVDWPQLKQPNNSVAILKQSSEIISDLHQEGQVSPRKSWRCVLHTSYVKWFPSEFHWRGARCIAAVLARSKGAGDALMT